MSILVPFVIKQYSLYTSSVVLKLKPENFIFDSQGHLKIIDFGTAALIPIEHVNEKIYEVYLNIKEKFDPNFDQSLNSDVKLDLKHAIDFSENHRSSLTFLEEYALSTKRRHSFVGTVYYL